MLSRLGIRQKLALLLVIPLLAVAAVLVPFTAERISDARSAGITARAADAARQVGALIQDLQQERLLAIGYLALTTLDRSALLSQTQQAQNDAAELLADAGTAPVLRAAGAQLSALDGVRNAVLDRAISASRTYDAFRAADIALLDALHLANPAGADAAGLAPLSSLDALMRSNEESSSVGALLVAAAADPEFSRSLLAAADTADQQYLSRFHELGDPAEVSLVDTVDNGPAGRRLREIVTQVSNVQQRATIDEVSDALTAAVTYTSLRRLAQDRGARDIAGKADRRATVAQITAWAVGGGAAVLFTLVVLLGVTVSASISRPLRRLTRAARVVADLAREELVRVADSDTPEPAPPRLAAVEVDSADEIGELATALNRVQATAALLLERQTSSRRNVGVMFANIARRTQTLVGRQLELIDDLERNERSPELLQRLYRLDHVATRLRRSADSLLVVSGTIDQVMSGTPTRLADIIRSSLAEIEGYRAVELAEIAPVAINATLIGDLRLLLAELLENATNFSPPTSPVMVTATMRGEDCHIAIVDHGLGMSAPKLDEENRRLVERERLELAPTNVLGLFVVGRIARRHGLGVRLDHSVDRGVTALVRIPGRLLTSGDVVGLPAAPTRIRPAPHPAIAAIDAVEVDVDAEPFGWFEADPDELVAISSGPEPATAGASAAPSGVDSRRADDRAVDFAAWAQAEPPARSTASTGVWGPPPGGAHSPTAAAATGRASVASNGGGDPRYPGADPAYSAGDDRPGTPLPRRAPGSTTAANAAMFSSIPTEFSATPTEFSGNPSDAGPIGRNGLVRRVPGTHMAAGIPEPGSTTAARRTVRDPEAERAALNDYLSGVARGDDAPDPQRGETT